MTNEQARRHQLRAGGYIPLPLYGKEPPIYGKNNKRKGLGKWQQLHEVSAEMIDMWSKTWPDAHNTGVLTRTMPTLDADILLEQAVRAIEQHVREHFEERGYILPRVGKPPKLAIPFRTEEPFKKIVVNLIAPDGSEGQKIEFLADGEQVVVAGIHPDTKQPYRWLNGEPGPIKLEDLPYIREAGARALVDDIVKILVHDFGYKRAPARPKGKRNGAKPHAGGGGGDSDWAHLHENIRTGRELHDSVCTLAAKMIASGMNSGATVNMLRGLMEGSAAPKDERWRMRVNEIPAAVDSAVTKYGRETSARSSSPARAEPAAEPPKSPKPAPKPKPPTSTYTIADALKVFRKWLALPNPTPIYATLGTVAANLLPGDPVWLGLLAPPSNAKTELIMSASGLPNVVQASTVTPGALLSGTPKKQQTGGAKGGLLRQIGPFGILLFKDFTSVLSMRQDAKIETLGALREIFDGSWTRHFGTDGGKTLTWKGKLGLLFGVTGILDSHYTAISEMGDRYLLCRLQQSKRQLEFALKHAGTKNSEMRNELKNAVTQLFASPLNTPPALVLGSDEYEEFAKIVALAVRLRGTVERDRVKREIESIPGAEGPGRMALCLERLLAGLGALGLERKRAFAVMKTVAMDSVPPLRRQTYEYLCANRDAFGTLVKMETPDIAEELGLPTNTVRRALEDLAAYHLVKRVKGGKGKADGWIATPPK
jgi:hypothetical protein